MAGITLNEGTQSNVATDKIGSVNYQIVKLDVGALGANSAFTGTLGAVTNIAGGTITALTKGTISAGTVVVNGGTVDAVSQFPPNPWGTTVSMGTNTLGTIKAAVAGSAIFVTDLIVSVGSATSVVIGMGGTSTPLVGSLQFNANSGLVSNFRTPGSVTSGSALVYQQSTGCPITITATGFVR